MAFLLRPEKTCCDLTMVFLTLLTNSQTFVYINNTNFPCVLFFPFFNVVHILEYILSMNWFLLSYVYCLQGVFSVHSKRLFSSSSAAEMMKLFLLLWSTQLTVMHQPLFCKARMYRNLLLRRSGVSVKIILIRNSFLWLMCYTCNVLI